MRILILSHAINMDGRAASQTVTDKIPYFQAAGFDLTVISAITGERDSHFKHHQVLPLTPVALRFDLRHYFRRIFGQSSWRYRCFNACSILLLGLPLILERILNRMESQTSWSISAFFTAWRSHRRQPFDVILSSGGAMAAHIAGYWMKKHFQLPWVAEIHDPLVYDGWDKSGAQLRLSRWLERKICTSADAAVWFTLKARDRALSRHPQLMNRGHCIYAGVDRPKLVQSESRAQNFSEKFVFAHFGSLSRTRSLLCFLQGLEVHLLSHPSHRHLIRVEIYGGGLDPQSLAFVHGQGLGDVVCQIGRLERDQHSGRSGRDRVLQRMGEVDCLLLLHGEQPVCEEYIPSKLYEYLWMGPVILGAVWRNPELESILLSQGHLAVPSNDVRGYSLCIASLLQDWSYARIPKPSRTSPYTAQRSSESLVNLIAQLKALNAQ